MRGQNGRRNVRFGGSISAVRRLVKRCLFSLCGWAGGRGMRRGMAVGRRSSAAMRSLRPVRPARAPVQLSFPLRESPEERDWQGWRRESLPVGACCGRQARAAAGTSVCGQRRLPVDFVRSAAWYKARRLRRASGSRRRPCRCRCDRARECRSPTSRPWCACRRPASRRRHG